MDLLDINKVEVVSELNEAPRILQELLNNAGINVNGNKPWDIHVHDARAYDQILSKWSLGLGETYVNGYWDCERLDDMLTRLLKVDLNMAVHGRAKFRLLAEIARAKLFNLQSIKRAFQVGERHYDAGNDIFKSILDSKMIYSCAYWEFAQNLEQAQTHKLELICRKLELKRGEQLLDIGCGWGGLAAYAATHFGVSVVGITVSKEQQKIAQERCQGLPVEIKLIDYRKLEGKFNKIVSVGMFEHVGEKNYRDYCQTASRLLEDQGLFLLHTIGSDVRIARTDPWIDRYIFPNGKIPCASELSAALEGLFLIEDWHNFGCDYDRTLMEWYRRLESHWPSLSQHYNERFYRTWKFYLLGCAAYFRSKQGQLWQLVLSKRSKDGPYRSFRLSR
jgi:cyclopropane-fatty-acyl-phospholipid synthase